MITGTTAVEVRRRISASPREVFAAWADPSLFPAWIAPDGRVVMNEPRVDGLFYIAMRHEGRVYPHYCRYLVIEPPQRLEFAWMSEGTEGHETTVALRFTPAGDGTELHLVHSGFPDAEAAALHEEGWGGFVEILAKRFG